jgi:2-(1,2-epoxy-1,2-dihydrophenyl)acetyl-CoA isomerase
VPVIAAVNGVAFGAGAGIAIGCDIVLATESARFQFGFVHVGLGPDSGVSHFLPQIVGHARALDIALTGRPLDAAEALEIGLVSRVVPDGALSAVTLEVAGGFAKRSAAALAETKRQMRNNPLKSLDQALDSERDVQSALGETAEYRDAVLRFTQKK